MGRRNWYSEGWNNRQMTPRGYPNFYSYLKNLRVFVFRTNERTDGQRHTPAARGLEKLFSTVLGRFLQPIHAMRVYCKN
jgi:hypothetical protein